MNLFDKVESISALQQDAERLQNTLEALNSEIMLSTPKNYEALALDAAMRGERLAVRLRDLVLSSTGVGRRKYLLDCANTQGVTATYEEGVLSLTLPRQLPKRRWKNTEFLTQPVMAALADLSERVELPRYQKAVVCFVHVVEHSAAMASIRDHDNIETKQILDVINACVLTDDNGILCEIHQRTERGDTAHTEVYVMAAETFPAWIMTRKSSESRGRKM